CCSEESPQLDLPVKAHNEEAKGKRWLPTNEAMKKITVSRSRSPPQIQSVRPKVALPVSIDRWGLLCTRLFNPDRSSGASPPS
ncbi:MAG: hypothetical protein ACMG6H_03955, partial [Acidobacteriota bacterium]